MAFGGYKSASSSQSTAATLHSVALPSALYGHLAYIFVVITDDLTDIATTPTGWTRVGRYTAASNSNNVYAFSRQCDGTEGSTVSIATSASVTSEHQVIALNSAVEDELQTSSALATTSVVAPTMLIVSPGETYATVVFNGYSNGGTAPTVTGWDADYPNVRSNNTSGGLGSALSLSNTSSSKPGSTNTLSGNADHITVSISVTVNNLQSVNATTFASVGMAATQVMSGVVAVGTSADVQVLGQGETPPNPPDGLAELLDIYAQTDAFCQVIQDVAGETTIAVQTSATAMGRASPVDSLKHMAAGTSASASMEGSPVVAASMTVSTDASATASTQLGEPNANCCCISPRNDCGSVVTITHRGPTASLTGLPVPNDDGSGNGIMATLGVFVAEPGEYRLYEVGSDGADTLLYATRTFPVLDGWSDPSISLRTRGYFVENGKTLRAEYLGDNGCRTVTTCVIYPWISEYACDRVWYSDPELYQGPAGASGCFGLDELNAWSTFAPTVSVQVTGLTGPMAALNGVYSGRPNVSDGFSDECGYEYLRRVCWVPDEGGFHWAEGFVLFKVSSFQQGAASIRVGTNHSWWTFGPPPLPVDCGTWLPTANITAGGYKQEYRDFSTLIAQFATKYASCSIECDLDPSVRLSRRTGKVFQGMGGIQSESSGECFFTGFGLDLVADHCFSAAEFTWL